MSCQVMRARSDSDLTLIAAQAVRLLRKPAAGELPVQVRNFDWHASLKDFREAGTVEALWQSVQPLVPGCGMAAGSISAQPSSAGAGCLARVLTCCSSLC